jgi:cytochrome c biogenesis protein CcdA
VNPSTKSTGTWRLATWLWMAVAAAGLFMADFDFIVQSKHLHTIRIVVGVMIFIYGMEEARESK